MAKRKWQQDSREIEQDDMRPSEAPTDPAIKASAMLAANDQFEAAKTGDANPPPSVADPPPPSAPKPVEELPSIPLKVFVKIAGPKWDQMAGFIRYAKMENFGSRTVPEWRASYQAFLQKPVK